MKGRPTTEQLHRLGYTEQWIDYGILTLEDFYDQEFSYINGPDKNSEHFRYQSFTKYLQDKTSLNDTEFENYLALTIADRDKTMAGSAAADLFSKISLSDVQFKQLCSSIQSFGKWTDQIVKRNTLLRLLQSGKLTNELFQSCLSSNDIFVQERLLELADKSQVERLSSDSNNKRIQHLAKERLRQLEKNSR